MNEISTLHDASPSWNGFNYQGKVGLYVCLQNILNKVQESSVGSEDFESFIAHHSIEYEWVEDFSIKKGDEYITLHQVKHKAGENYSDHIEALATILRRKTGILSDADLFKYLEFFGKNKETEQKEIKEQLLNNELLTISNTLESDWRDKLNSLPPPYQQSVEKCLSDFEHLYNNAFSNSKVYFHTSECIKEAWKDLDKYQEFYHFTGLDLRGKRDLTHLDIYLSSDHPETYLLSVSDAILEQNVDKLIKDLIILINNNPTVYSVDDLRLYRIALLAIVDKHIVERHKDIRSKTNNGVGALSKKKANINFTELFEVFKKDFREHNSEYWNLICRENFEIAYKEHLDDMIASTDDSVSEYQKYLKVIERYRLQIFNDYFPSHCDELMIALSPNQTKGENERIFYEGISSRREIKEVFFEFIQAIVSQPTDIKFKCTNALKLYHSSCIDLSANGNSNRQKNKLNKVRKGLANNRASNIKTLQNVDYIVVESNSEEDELSAGIDKITDISDDEVNSNGSTQPKKKMFDKYTEPKEIFFINYKKALGKINE